MRRRWRIRPRFAALVALVAVLVLTLSRVIGHSVHAHTPESHRASHAVTGGRVLTAAPEWHWARAGSLPAPTKALSLAANPSVLVAVGGLSPSGTTGTVATVAARHGSSPSATLTTPVHDAASAILGETLYVFGGGQTNAVPTIQAVPLSGAAVTSPAPLPEAVSNLAAVAHDGSIYLVGGTIGTTGSNQVWRWTPHQGLSAVASLPHGVAYAAVAWYDGAVWIAGGLVNGGGYSDAVYSVDPATGRVTSHAPLPVPIAYAGLAALDGRLYLAGGLTVAGASDTVWWHAAGHRGWTPAPASLPTATYWGALASFDGHLWYVGGATDRGATRAIWVSENPPAKERPRGG